MLKFLLRPFCNHTYIQSVSCNSERVSNDNYVYSYEYYECKKCNHRFTFKILQSVDKDYYADNSK